MKVVGDKTRKVGYDHYEEAEEFVLHRTGNWKPLRDSQQ